MLACELLQALDLREPPLVQRAAVSLVPQGGGSPRRYFP